MNPIQKLLGKVQEFLYPANPVKKGEVFLCVFLRYEDDYIFLTSSEEDLAPKEYRPLLIPISELGYIEEHFFKINNFMFEEFDISLDKMYVVPDSFSLAPLLDQTYYFAAVDLTPEDLKELKNNKTFGVWVHLPIPYIALQAKENFFFNIVGRILGI